jgi:hypothetical protein
MASVNQELLIGKLHERWITEKTAVELYDLAAAVARFSEEDELAARLERMRKQEHAHEELLEDVLRRFGRDPHDPHPEAESARIQGQGMVEVLSRPDLTVTQALQVLLAAELVDEIGWELLEDLCVEAGIDEDFIRDVRAARRQELEHVHVIRDALEARLMDELEQPAT